MLLEIILILSIIYIIYLIGENQYKNNSRKNIKHVIHVNGTRGKSTVTRLIGTMLRKNNYKTLTKVTGTIPTIIEEDGHEKEIKRLSNPNIIEQLHILNKASKKKVDCLVIECMAITPEYQKVTERKILKSNIGIITNARKDHEEILSNSKGAVINALSNTIPKDGILIIPEKLKKHYKNKANSLNTKIITYDKFIRNQDIDYYDENVAIALAVASIFKINIKDALNSLKDYPKDIGALKIFKRENHSFISAFSINDNESLTKTLKKIKEEIEGFNELTILLNNRKDRQYRVKKQLKLISSIKPEKVILAGSNYNYSKRYLNKNNIKAIKYNKNINLESYKLILGMGNIKGLGLELINKYNV